MDKAHFGQKLKELREKAGLSQKQLAEKAGVSQMGVSQYERGVREPHWSTAVTLAQALGVSCEAFQDEVEQTGEPKRGRPRKQA